MPGIGSGHSRTVCRTVFVLPDFLPLRAWRNIAANININLAGYQAGFSGLFAANVRLVNLSGGG